MVQEIVDLVEADNVCTVLSADSTPVVITNRLTQFNCPTIDNALSHSGGFVPLQLSEIIIIGNCYGQIHFSEITVDMYRMLQCLERDTQDKFGQMNVGGLREQQSFENDDDDYDFHVFGGSPISGGDKKAKNPHKYLLYKPSISTFNCFMSAGFKDLPPDGVLLLYISADGMKYDAKSQSDRKFFACLYYI